jgi:hypothetical protein
MTYKNIISIIRIVPFIVILFIGIYLRFDGITTQGLNRGDGVKYLAESARWASDDLSLDFMGGRFYRPAVYAIQGLGIKLFGYNDYSVKIVNSTIDTLNIILLFIIAALCTRNYLIGTIASLFYATNPKIVSLARIEMVHVQSEFFVMMALLTFIMFYRNDNYKNYFKYLFIITSGIFSYYSINTHAELIFVTPVFYAFILYKYSFSLKNHKFALIFISLFTAGHILPFIFEIIMLGPNTVLTVIGNEISFYMNPEFQNRFTPDNKIFMPFKILFYSLYLYYRNTFFVFGGLFLAGYLLLLKKDPSKYIDNSMIYLLMSIVTSYLFLFSLSFSVFPRDAGRLLLPLIPAITIITFYSLYRLVIILLKTTKIHKYSNHLFVALGISLFFVSVKILPNDTDYRTQVKRVHTLISPMVNSSNKLLIGPLIAYSRDNLFQNELYFKKDAIYMSSCSYGGIINVDYIKDQLIKNKYGYLYITRDLDDRMLQHDYPYTPKIMIEYEAVNGFTYSLQQDLMFYNKLLTEMNGILIEKNDFGYLFELQSDKFDLESASEIDYFESFEKSKKYYQEIDSPFIRMLKQKVGNKY